MWRQSGRHADIVDEQCSRAGSAENENDSDDIIIHAVLPESHRRLHAVLSNATLQV